MKNRISAVVTKGFFKDSTIEIELGSNSLNTSIQMNGKPIKCTGIWIKCIPGKPTKVTIEKLVD